MLQVYHGTGAQDFETSAEALLPAEWQMISDSACDLLYQRSDAEAARLLQRFPFVPYRATNGFGDEFHAIVATIAIPEYTRLSAFMPDDAFRNSWRAAARALTEVGFPVRFIGLQPEKRTAPSVVPAPTPRVTNKSVESALREAQILLDAAGAASAVDRAHTAMHAYLREVCAAAELNCSKDATATELFKRLREEHPAFRTVADHDTEIVRILRAMATILDSAGTLRNRASGAHPNATRLGEAEAIMVINAVRTMLHYIDAKLK